MRTKSFLSNLFQAKAPTFLILLMVILSLSANSLAKDDLQDISPRQAKKLLKQAKKLRRNGRHTEAEKILKQIIARYPQNSDAKLALAYIFLKEKRLLDAYNYSFDIAKADEKNSYAFAILGATYLSAGNFDEAGVLLRNSIALNRKEALAWAGLGMLSFYENRINESIQNLREAVYLDSKEPDFIFALAQVAARSERYKEAANAYDRFLRIANENNREKKERIKGLIRFLSYLGRKSSLYDLAGEPHTEVPIRLINNRPVIKVKIRKYGKPLNFVLDTGSGNTVISKRTAKRLGIKAVTKGGQARAIGGDGKFRIVYGFLNAVRIGKVRVRNVPIYIRKFHRNLNHIDGYIGLSVISKYVTTIDYGNRRFVLTNRKQYRRNPIERLKLGTTVPLRRTSSGFLSGLVKLKGFETALSFIVDTGASVSVISEELADSQEMQQYILAHKMNVIGAAGISENVSSFLLPSVTFAGYKRHRLKAIALDLHLINEASGFEQAGIIGGNFLKDYSLTFDFAQSKVTFVPNDKK